MSIPRTFRPAPAAADLPTADVPPLPADFDIFDTDEENLPGPAYRLLRVYMRDLEDEVEAWERGDGPRPLIDPSAPELVERYGVEQETAAALAQFLTWSRYRDTFQRRIGDLLRRTGQARPSS